MIRPGQIYESCKEPDARIKVLSRPASWLLGYGKVQVATLEGGRELRPRDLDIRQLHESGTTRDGQPRRTGYRLVQDVEEGQ